MFRRTSTANWMDEEREFVNTRLGALRGMVSLWASSDLGLPPDMLVLDTTDSLQSTTAAQVQPE